MTNPREGIKYDIPKEWIKNFKKGCCPVCGKTKFEFNKGMKVYCSKKCRKSYSDRIYTWQELRDKILKKRGEKCEECGFKRELIKKKADKKIKLLKLKYLKEHPEVIEQKRKELMDVAEEYYKQAQELDKEENLLSSYLVPYNLYRDLEREQYTTFEVDHIKAIVNGGDMWDENNLQVLCENFETLNFSISTNKEMGFSRLLGIKRIISHISNKYNKYINFPILLIFLILCHRKKTKKDLLERKNKPNNYSILSEKKDKKIG